VLALPILALLTVKIEVFDFKIYLAIDDRSYIFRYIFH